MNKSAIEVITIALNELQDFFKKQNAEVCANNIRNAKDLEDLQMQVICLHRGGLIPTDLYSKLKAAFKYSESKNA